MTIWRRLAAYLFLAGALLTGMPAAAATAGAASKSAASGGAVSTSAASGGAFEENIVLGFYSSARREWTHAEVRATFDLWARELSEKFNIPVEIVHYDDPVALRRDFMAGKLHGVNTDVMTLVRYFKPDELTDGYATIMKGGWNLLLQTATTGQVRGPEDFPGKRLVLLEQDEVGALWIETLCLRHHQRPCDKVFASIAHAPNSNQALMRVFFGHADLALVHGYGHELAVEMNPQLGRATRKIAEYPMRSQFLAYYKASVDKGLRERTLPIMPTLHTYPRGRQLLDIFKVDHLEIATTADLGPAQALENEYRQLKARGVRKGERR